MGVFSVPVKITPTQNRWVFEDLRGEVVECDALVDTGAIELALPRDLVRRLRLEQTGSMRGRTADGVRHELRVVGPVLLGVKGRTCNVSVVELPEGADLPVLGSIPLQAMDWHVDSRGERLVPNPDAEDGGILQWLCFVA